MARSNGPQSPPGGRIPRPDPQNWAQGTPAPRATGRPIAQPNATQSYAQPGAAPQPAYPQSGGQPQSAGAAYQQAAYAAQQGQPVAQPTVRTAPPQQRSAPAAAPASTSAFEALMAQEDPHSYGTQLPYNPAAAHQPSYAAAASAKGYGQRAAAATPAEPSLESWNHDAGFGQPGAGASQGYGGQAHAGYGHGAYDQASGYGAEHGSFGAADDWGQGSPYAEHGHQNEPSLDAGYGGYGDTPGYDQEHQGSNLEQSYEDDYEDEPRRRRRMPLIAAAAVGALLCGGGLAYGYKAFLAPGDGKTPVIKSSASPSKVKPDDPGGRKFAHSENKIMGGPLNDAEAGGSPSETGSTDGARKVSTVEVRPDGTVVSSPSPAEPAASPPPSVTASAADFPAAGDVGGPPPAAAPPPEPPKVIAKAEPTPPPAAAPAPQMSAAAEEPPAAPAPKKVAAKKIAAAAAPTQPIGPQPTGAGWVAVLASVPVSEHSQSAAIKQFADMEQKYPSVLSGKVPSVQEANLGEKGRYHRLVVGPPASRESAASICESLKSQGYSDCWPLQF